MPKPVPETLAALFLISTLSACASLPSFPGVNDAADSAKTPDNTSVDSRQSSDPRGDSRPAVTTTSSELVEPSPDVVVARRPATPAPAERKPEPRVAAVIPVSGQPTVQSVGTGVSGAAGTVAGPSPTPKTRGGTRPATASGGAKSKSKSAPAPSRDLWGRMRGRLALAEVTHPRIDEQIAYLKRNPGYLNLLAQRARPYLHYIVEHIDRRNLPMDLAVVPMVESAFEPTAVSPREAAGLWQIIPATGQEQGLVLTEGYDGRFDIHNSTEAALSYLRYLHKRFDGDWLLALAAYNAGPRAVQDALAALAGQPAPATPAVLAETHPAIARVFAASSVPVAQAPPSPFWSLKLPEETRNYVPRIAALARIIADPETHGVRLQAIDNQPYLYRVDLTPEIRVFDRITAAGIPTEEFLRFNPGFKPGVEPPAHPYKLLLPREQAQILVANAPGARLSVPSRYTVQKGETLDMIAKRHGVASQQLAQWNRLNGRGVLKAGQELLIYPSS